MPGTRTAPTVDGASLVYIRIVFRLVDSRGDLRTVSWRADTNVSFAAIETAAAALQAATNSSLYSVKLENVWEGDRDAGNADEAVVESVYDNIAINYKDIAAGKQVTAFVPAPIGGLILDGDVVDTDDQVYIDFRDAITPTLDGTFTPVTTRFTERRDKNDATPA